MSKIAQQLLPSTSSLVYWFSLENAFISGLGTSEAKMTIMPLGIRMGSEEYSASAVGGLPMAEYFTLLAAKYNGEILCDDDIFVD